MSRTGFLKLQLKTDIYTLLMIKLRYGRACPKGFKFHVDEVLKYLNDKKREIEIEGQK